LGDKSIERLPESKIHFQFNEDSNSLALLVRHMSGNMLSRWTDFLTTDGEKPWRNRDSEFEAPDWTKDDLWVNWENGWTTLFEAIESLNETDLEKIVYIRNEGHTVMEAINRQIAHYAYHVGQLIFLVKAITAEWETLSIARNKSQDYNTDKFSKDKGKRHFV
ncbi:MAG: DUF1572 family protein, partial [Bacteroidia bacterium]